MNEIVVVPWSKISRDEFFDIVRLRTEVFFVEQRIDEPDFSEVDRDARTMHYWIADQKGLQAYLRVVFLDEPDHGASISFGRVAVRMDCRGRGLAKRLLNQVLDTYGAQRIVIHSQEYVAPMYATLGFNVIGGRYYEAGLPHLLMVWEPSDHAR